MSDEDLRRLRHDLRSPLVLIGGFAGLLASDRPMELDQRRDYAERIERAATELEHLIADTLG